jgi:hypothetical protein
MVLFFRNRPLVAAGSNLISVVAATDMSVNPTSEVPRRVASMLTNAQTAGDVASLLQRLVDPDRARPIVVVTTLFESGEPLLDVAALEADVDGVADVVLVTSGNLTYQLAAGLPSECAPFNGAVCSFPTGDEWLRRPSLARHRFTFLPGDADRLLRMAVDDLLGMAYRAGLTVTSTVSARPTGGIIQGMLADDSRALVKLDDGSLATISAEVTFAPAPLPWVIREGVRVTGMLDPETRRLALDSAITDANDLWSHFPDGSVTLALVHEVERQRATLLIHPQHPVAVVRGDLSPNPLDRVDLLLSEGDVIEVRVVRDQQGRRALRTIDLNDDEPTVPSVALTPGGAPWLEVGRSLLEPETELTITSIEQFLNTIGMTRSIDPDLDLDLDVDVDNVADVADVHFTPQSTTLETPPPLRAMRPGPGPRTAIIAADTSADSATSPAAGERRTALQSALATIDELKARLRVLRAEYLGPGNSQLRTDVEQLKSVVAELEREKQRALANATAAREKLKDAQASLRSARRTTATAVTETPRDRRSRFASADDWIGHELYLQWVDRFDASTRTEHPLPPQIVIGPRFPTSLETLDDGQLIKALRCAMEAVTGFINKVPARGVHPLRSGDGATDAPLVRAGDGARCLRAYAPTSSSAPLKHAACTIGHSAAVGSSSAG